MTLDVDVLWDVLSGKGIIDNGTWVSFRRQDAEDIAAAYAAALRVLPDSDAPTPREAALREALDCIEDMASDRDYDTVTATAAAGVLRVALQAAASTAAAGEGATGDDKPNPWVDPRDYQAAGEGEQVPFPDAVRTALGLMRSAILSGEQWSVELAAAYEDAVAGLRATSEPACSVCGSAVVPTHVSPYTGNNDGDGYPDHIAAIRSSRATSETPREAPLAGLEVERLARALVWRRYGIRVDEANPADVDDARVIAAEYARLLAARGSE
jgi:hypothetical protein